MNFNLCAACRRKFQIRPQVRNQRYCSARKCQRKRRQRWQKDKRKNDLAYKKNQSWAQKDWAKRNPNYWKNYNSAHLEHRKRNRKLQRTRNRRRGEKLIAKMDASALQIPVPSGTYRMVPVNVTGEKMDAWIVEITVISKI